MCLFGSGSSIKNFAGLVYIQAGSLQNMGDWGSSAGSMTLEVDSGAYFDLRTASAVVKRAHRQWNHRLIIQQPDPHRRWEPEWQFHL